MARPQRASAARDQRSWWKGSSKRPKNPSTAFGGPPPRQLPGRMFQSPNGQVSSALVWSPGRVSPGSGATASVSSNHTQASNWSGRIAWL